MIEQVFATVLKDVQMSKMALKFPIFCDFLMKTDIYKAERDLNICRYSKNKAAWKEVK